MVFSGAVGLEFDIDRSFNLRTEFEFIQSDINRENARFWHGVSYQEWDVRFRTQAYMVNVFIDLFSNWRISPYLGAGFGIANVQNTLIMSPNLAWSQDLSSSTDMNVAFGLYAGVGIDITRRLTADIGARMIGFRSRIADTSLSWMWPTETNAENSLIHGRAGLRYTF